MSIKIEDILWDEWKIESVLGKGSYGTVYKVYKDSLGEKIYSAVKHMSIPNNRADIDSLRAEGMSDEQIDSYYRDSVNNISHEIMLMENLKGTTNVVNIEDFKIIKREDAIGWDILIRMEVLDDLNFYFKKRRGPITDIVKIGIDLCNALEICNRQNIIHRDIKPENIFVNKYGDFKLGDFGIARHYQTNLNMSMRGTPFYAAPEMFEGGQYDQTVDIYSLGLVLYRLLNANRLPFMPIGTAANFNERQQAVTRRLSGEPLPNPVNSTPKLSKILKKACAKNPHQRYQTPTEFKKALESAYGDLQRTREIPQYDFSSTKIPRAPTPVTGNLSKGKMSRTALDGFDNSIKSTKVKKLVIAVSSAVAVIAVSIIAVMALSDSGDPEALLVENTDNSGIVQTVEESSNEMESSEEETQSTDESEYVEVTQSETQTEEETEAQTEETTKKKKKTTTTTKKKKKKTTTTTKKKTTTTKKKTTKKKKKTTTTTKKKKKKTTTTKKKKTTATTTTTTAAVSVGSVGSVSASKSGGNIRIKWSSASNASSYSIEVSGPDGYHTKSTSSTVVQIPVSENGYYSITVTPIGADGTTGGAGSAGCSY